MTQTERKELEIILDNEIEEEKVLISNLVEIDPNNDNTKEAKERLERLKSIREKIFVIWEQR